MSRSVMCKKYQQQLEGLEAPPYPGAKGQKIYETISKKAWGEWLTLQTMLINEYRLSVREPEARTYLGEQMDKFFNNEATDHAEGYVPPSD
jgi:Fe-S cluster biosynthesis and repair protein YggX